ncbi:MAG: hypothetical protein SFW36_01270 [Leptolyngbyaceae cyanobacterium bins.59]|nr:hypothetical protein [Leptolyngbyaceae cyanobacterium bins.59]
MLPILGFSELRASAQVSSADCATWNSVRPQVVSLYGVAPNLPERFRQGCVYGVRAAYTTWIYVFENGRVGKVGSSGDVLFSHPIIPALDTSSISDHAAWEGKVLQIFNACGSLGTERFCDQHPVDRPYINTRTKTACLKRVCVILSKSPELELYRLWSLVEN